MGVSSPDLVDYVKKSDLDSYLKIDDLQNYTKPTDPIQNLNGYVKNDQLNDYIKKIDAPNLVNYVKREEIPDFKTIDTNPLNNNFRFFSSNKKDAGTTTPIFSATENDCSTIIFPNGANLIQYSICGDEQGKRKSDGKEWGAWTSVGRIKYNPNE